ncbi:MAG TPA: endonuclease Q family protein [Candidatus Kapabacteria bacterium]|nr:endonuclease Q family protein [Candidatus Kapabacteria bacterium]
MANTILDLHVHSKYSRACSKDLELESIANACEVRGIHVVATGDFTHPAWFQSMKEKLVEETSGIYMLKDGSSKTKFLIGTEVASIKKHKDKVRRVHHLLFAPNLETAERLNQKLTYDGFNLRADGRPILGMTSKELLQYILDVDQRMVMIPAHAWTPWFGIFGSKGGYNTLDEAFEELTPHIFAIETGLSSDPLMNWQYSHLDRIACISNSDAHSTAKLGREANVMRFDSDDDMTYDEIMRILRERDKEKFIQTIEFYPEEGKYHYDGHAACLFSCPPDETKRNGGLCPTCKKPLVIGVMNRVAELADRSEAEARALERVPYVSIIPLPEIIADTFGVGVASKAVKAAYDQLIHAFQTEFSILLDVSIDDIKSVAGAQIAEAVDRVRKGYVVITPGYDGLYGIIKVFGAEEPRGRIKQGKLLLE